MLETHKVSFQGHAIMTVLDHATAADILAVAKHPLPLIPAGCNTILSPFTTAAGQRALAINQTGFNPVAADNERQTNGLTVLILNEPMAQTDADTLLEAFYEFLNQ